MVGREQVFSGEVLFSAPLVGRGRELALLRDALGRPPAAVTVAGEAGVGKTRLVRELLGDSGERRVLLGRCHRVREPFPLGPVIEALRGVAGALPACSLSPVVGALRPLLPELSSCLPEEPVPLDDPRAQRHRTFRGLRELLDALGETVCVLEDLHWADGETLEFLSFLLAEPPGRLALVLTHRGEELHPARSLPPVGSGAATGVLGRTIELAPLSVEEVGTLAGALAGIEQVAQPSARYLHAHTGGIAFAVEEVVGLLAERGELALLAEGCATELAALGVPPTLRLWVLERIGRLGADARAVACAAAVLGRPASEDLLRAMAGLSAMRANRAVVEGLRAGVLAEPGDALYGFRQALAMQAVYEDIPTPERRRLHLRAARAIEDHSEPRALAQIAHHFRQAGRVRQWVRYAEAAAQAAHSRADDRCAVELLEQALGAPALPRATRTRMAIALGNAALYSPSPQSAIAVLERALDQESMSILPAGVRGELRFSLCRLRWHAGQSEHWREEMLLAVEELRRRPSLAARAMVNLALPARLTEGDLGEHRDWLHQAERTATRQGDPVTHIAVAAQRAAILLTLGDPAGWDAIADLPADPGSVDEKLQLLRGYSSLCVAAIGLGHYTPAESLLTETERIHANIDHCDWSLELTRLRTSLDCATGRWQGLEARARAGAGRGSSSPGCSSLVASPERRGVTSRRRSQPRGRRDGCRT